jgi:hypothetical protein
MITAKPKLTYHPLTDLKMVSPSDSTSVTNEVKIMKDEETGILILVNISKTIGAPI